MKKIYIISILSLGLNQSINAQVIFNASNYPNLGSSILYSFDTLGTAFSIQGGTNQNWNFSQLQTHAIATLEYVNPASTPFAAHFPTANHVSKSGENYTFNRVDSDGVFELGQASGPPFNVVAKFSNEARTYRFPLSYASSYDSNFKYAITFDPGMQGFDSVRISSDVTYNFIVDSWGSVTIPSGTYPCIRKIQTITSSDTLLVLVPNLGWQLVDISTNNRNMIYFLNPNVGAPLIVAQPNIDDDGNENGFTVQHYTSGTVGMDMPLAEQFIQTYPNPASDIVNIKIQESRPLQIMIFDSSGRLVDTQHTTTGNHVLNTNSLVTGFYTLRIQDFRGNIIGTSKISIAR